MGHTRSHECTYVSPLVRRDINVSLFSPEGAGQFGKGGLPSGGKKEAGKIYVLFSATMVIRVHSWTLLMYITFCYLRWISERN